MSFSRLLGKLRKMVKRSSSPRHNKGQSLSISKLPNQEPPLGEQGQDRWENPRKLHHEDRAKQKQTEKSKCCRYRSRIPQPNKKPSSPTVSKSQEAGKSCRVWAGKPDSDPVKSRKQCWWKLTEQELRDEYERCRAKAPRVHPNFLSHGRDSLDEASILSARGLKQSPDTHSQSSSPTKERRGRTCPCCFQALPETPSVAAPGRPSGDSQRSQGRSQDTPRPSKIPVAVHRKSNPSAKSSPRSPSFEKPNLEAKPPVANSVEDKPYYSELAKQLPARCVSCESMRNYITEEEKRDVQAWWRGFLSSSIPNLNLDLDTQASHEAEAPRDVHSPTTQEPPREPRKWEQPRGPTPWPRRPIMPVLEPLPIV
ncbi:uncharacterized protein GGS25DRAFT_496960 [Hypoxylon fragiforme]|uniref:uncharacterized protein n=1 Tax=Hypoxylon fragiforme TaxID=63214 RepID=UPI0020C643F4|nr:uncharacterized protein GGS25DRAFT_496960 [Hypoxylon fragiforme]KAI2607654.1 hypothetical protein GGS25DRAFT_496960 [Hypoxylon fragiforme]